jgi:hypothetical protein
MERYNEQCWRPLGDGCYAVLVKMPWGELVPAQVLVASREGWFRRPESGDVRWSAYPVGPAVVAIRLLGGFSPDSPARPDPLSSSRPPIRRLIDSAPEEWSGLLAVGACQ